jgi:hypothetical protein
MCNRSPSKPFQFQAHEQPKPRPLSSQPKPAQLGPPPVFPARVSLTSGAVGRPVLRTRSVKAAHACTTPRAHAPGHIASPCWHACRGMARTPRGSRAFKPPRNHDFAPGKSHTPSFPAPPRRALAAKEWEGDKPWPTLLPVSLTPCPLKTPAAFSNLASSPFEDSFPPNHCSATGEVRRGK